MPDEVVLLVNDSGMKIVIFYSDIYNHIFHRYRITEGVNLPFRVLPTIKELGRTRMEVNVKVCNSQRI